MSATVWGRAVSVNLSIGIDRSSLTLCCRFRKNLRHRNSNPTKLMSVRVYSAICAAFVLAASSPAMWAEVVITPADGFVVEWDGNDGDHFDATSPPDGAVVPDNLALAANGATPFASGDLGPELNIDFHVAENLNDGIYGNSNSWIGGSSDEEPWFAGIEFGGSVEIGAVAWGRDNGNGEWDDSAGGTDACGGQCDDRSDGIYELQITSDPSPGAGSSWTTVAEFDYVFSDDIEPGGDFTSYLRHQYSIGRTDGSPIEVTGLRLLVPGTGLGGGTAIDEIEVYGAPSPMQLIEEGGEMAESNVALGATAFAKDLINGGGFAAHQIPHINDGIFGNSNSWIGASEGSFVGVSLGASAFGLQSLAFGRDNTGQFTDRSVGTYIVQFTEVSNPDETTPDDDWETLDTLDYTQTSALLSAPHLRHRYNFEETDATGIRIVTFNGACIDELELYTDQGDVVAPPPMIAPVEEGGEIAEGNLAQGGTAFAKDVINGGGFAVHQIAHLNDGMFSNDFSWIGDSAGSFAGINLGASNVTVRSFAFGRDNTGALGDRAVGVYTIQVTQMPNPDETLPETAWTTLGIVNLQAGNPANPALRHRYNIDSVDITGLRIITPGAGIGSGAAIDELEIYATEYEPPQPDAIDIQPAAGFSITWDGNDGDHFDITPPEDGAIVPDNLALATNGATPLGSSELGPELGIDYHLVSNINDGFYGNLNSWISAGGDGNPFAGVALGATVEIDRIAWGRDNGNGAIDDSDSGTDACGGQCNDRSPGVYEIQITEIANPDNETPDSDWTTIGTIDYRENLDDEVGGDATLYLRHEYVVSNTDGSPLLASGVRILVPSAGLGGGTAIDEIEVYGIAGTRTLRPIEEGGEFAEDNLATAGTAFAFDLLGDGSFAPTHTIENVNNGSYGNGSSWIGNSENSFVGINLGANPVTLASIAFGRDNTGGFSDRSVGTYTLQYTTTANPDETTADEQWMTIGEIVYSAGNPTNPQLRHRFNFPEVMATGIRLFTPGAGIGNGTAVDEIELYADPLIVIPPLPEALEITPSEGFEITWDGNDGANFDPISPDDGGSVVPDNFALTSNGSTAFGSGELGVDLGLDFHLFPNANDGLYGNSNSWIGNSEPQFIGINFGGSVEMSRIAWGRDNGNGEWDGSDPGTDACGGQCGDRNAGRYTLQVTTVANPDENTADADWVTIGEFNYKFSDDTEPGGDFTAYLRHEYNVTTTGGGAISATGVRILSPNGTAIDEIEVYGAARDPFLTFDDGDEASFTVDNLDVQFIGFDFENRGAGQELVISSVTFEGANAGNFSLFSALEPVAAGAAGSIVANFDPQGASGVFTAEMVVASNDSQQPEQRISITVQVNAEVDPGKDTDGDGVPDVREIAAGTDPNDAGSFFAAKSITQSDGSATLAWSSVDGKTYSVQFSDTLQPDSWQQVAGADSISATAGGTTTFTIPATVGVNARWFRVLVQ